MILFNLLMKILSFEAGKSFRKYLENIGNPYKCQEKGLLRKIKASRNSDFGKKHNFDKINSIDSFRENVPINCYEDLKPYLDDVKNGNLNALFNPREKIIMFAITSGTTNACKYIPVTKRFLKEYKFGSLIWGIQMFIDHPNILQHKILPIVSPYDETTTDNGCPCGSISGLVASTQKYVARSLYVLPYWVYSIPDQEAKYYTMLRIAMADKIGLITTANPSTLIKFAQLADKYKDKIIKDIHDGTFYFDIPIGKKLKKSLLKNPARAKELEKLAKTHNGLYPKHFWPDLELLATWKGGVLSHYIKDLPQYYGDVDIRELGLIASEGRMSIPFNDDSASGVLDVSSHLFEFIPETEYDKKNYTTLLCNQVEIGKKYYLIMTNSAGFFRYDINDLIEVTGFFEETPVIKFLNKGKHISSLTGEKISEYQVIRAMEKTRAGLNIPFSDFTVSPCWSSLPYYNILMEENHSLNNETILKLIASFDNHLMEQNCEYQNKRETKRLDKPRFLTIKNGTFDEIKSQKIKQSQGRSEQYKHIYLNPQMNYHENIDIIRELRV